MVKGKAVGKVSTLRFSAVPPAKLGDLYGILAPRSSVPPFDRVRERADAAAAAARYDEEKTARITKRAKK